MWEGGYVCTDRQIGRKVVRQIDIQTGRQAGKKKDDAKSRISS
jgi:hypothetical protein